jgi:hypothetical protein
MSSPISNARQLCHANDGCMYDALGLPSGVQVKDSDEVANQSTLASGLSPSAFMLAEQVNDRLQSFERRIG